MEATPVVAVKEVPAVVPQPLPVKVNWRGLLNTWQQKNPQRAGERPIVTEVAPLEGPGENQGPHNRTFRFSCKLTLDGTVQEVIGQGQAKKIAKADAAKKMY